MLFEDQGEWRDFITIHRKDYISRHSERPTQIRPQQEYEPPLNAITGPYQEHLKTKQKNDLLPEAERSEDPDLFLARVRREKAHLEGFLPERLPDEDLIEREKENLQRTVYGLDYIKEGFSSGRRKRTSLPENWIIPETIQKRSYRNPREFVDVKLLRPTELPKPKNNLDPNMMEREIRRVRTGESEYGYTIGAVGERLLQNHEAMPVAEDTRSAASIEAAKKDCEQVLTWKPLCIPSRVI